MAAGGSAWRRRCVQRISRPLKSALRRVTARNTNNSFHRFRAAPFPPTPSAHGVSTFHAAPQQLPCPAHDRQHAGELPYGERQQPFLHPDRQRQRRTLAGCRLVVRFDGCAACVARKRSSRDFALAKLPLVCGKRVLSASCSLPVRIPGWKANGWAATASTAFAPARRLPDRRSAGPLCQGQEGMTSGRTLPSLFLSDLLPRGDGLPKSERRNPGDNQFASTCRALITGVRASTG